MTVSAGKVGGLSPLSFYGLWWSLFECFAGYFDEGSHKLPGFPKHGKDLVAEYWFAETCDQHAETVCNQDSTCCSVEARTLKQPW